MRGVITRRDVLLHSAMIVRLFGPRAYLRCLRAAFRAEPTTFLQTVFVSHGVPRRKLRRTSRRPALLPATRRPNG